MKRNIYPSTSSAAAWWLANPNAQKADCFAISLPTGQTLYVTEGQWDITVPASMSPTGAAILFSATKYGLWTRGKITSEASFRCNSNTMKLNMVPTVGMTYPGLSVSMLYAAFNHLFDGATVWVYTAYMPFDGYGNVQVFETKFQGRIVRAPQIGRILCEFEVSDPFFLLNQKVPSRLLQSDCYKAFADANCGLTASNYTISFTAAAASTKSVLTPVTALTQADGYFTQGVVTCVTGNNAGLSQTVKANTGGTLTMMVPWLFSIAAGDTFTAIKGCDQTPTSCAAMKWTDGTTEVLNWRIRFGGTPYVPVPSTSL